MEQLGQTVSSNSDIFINFRSAQNKSDIPQKMIIIPEISQKNSKIEEIVEQKIFSDRGMPFILLNTSLCERPIKLYIDTGATVSIIADDVIKNDIIIENDTLNLLGITGKEVSIKTLGMVHSIFQMGNTFLKSKLHTVDRKYAGPGDGFLGFDFLAPYKVNIDLDQLCLRINLKNIITNEMKTIDLIIKEETEENLLTNEIRTISETKTNNLIIKEETEQPFLNILAQNYEFETINSSINSIPKKSKIRKSMNTEKTKSNKYFDPTKAFEKNTTEYEKYPIFPSSIQNTHNGDENSFNKLKLDEYPEKEKDIMKNICIQYSPQFYLARDPIGTKNVFKHNVHLLPKAKMVMSKQLRIPQGLKKPQEKIANCGGSTLMKKECSRKQNKIETPLVDENYKNSDSIIPSVHYFKDYG